MKTPSEESDESSGGAGGEREKFKVPEIVKRYKQEKNQASGSSSHSWSNPRVCMIRFNHMEKDENSPRTPKIDERLVCQPRTPEPQEEPKTPEVKEHPKTLEFFENSNRKNSRNQQAIFEKIHKELVYDTIEQNLSNLIDVQPEGVYDSKEMTIELEKKMTFKFRVHTSHPKELKRSVDELINHFEGKLDYKLEKVTDSTEDSEEESFPQNILMRKETVTEERTPPEGHHMKTISMAEYKERKEQEEFSRRMNYALRPRQNDEKYQEWYKEQRLATDFKREENL
jgi:hypothetical protein